MFTNNLFGYERVVAAKVPVGNIEVGGGTPVKVQSMTTTNTNDVEQSVEQAVRIIEAGGQIVRFTTQGSIEAQSMKKIREQLSARGYDTPLVADVHFNAQAAFVAAGNVEKVRINPGNFTGGAKKFDENADKLSQEEWMKLVTAKLAPLVDICKANGTTLRIGVNHGSLSDRIMAKYGDTPQGMVASCIEYIEALHSLDFYRIVISIKASNTKIMVCTVRLLSEAMRQRGYAYPLHLGVTEAGSDEEGRIKSAAGIGALMIDGLGDTIRVSLTEAPENEIPVAKALVDYIATKQCVPSLQPCDVSAYSPYEYKKRLSVAVGNIGGNNQPVVMLDATKGGVVLGEADLLYTASEPFIKPLTYSDVTPEVIAELKANPSLVVLAKAETANPTVELRAVILKLTAAGVTNPVIVSVVNSASSKEQFQLEVSADLGMLFIDGLADGLMITNTNMSSEVITSTALAILQATQSRFSKTEFISCPGCGRTLYDIQSTVRKVKERMGHLKQLKIGIMGCIVNGIGEMADAHYGYVGAGRGKISLYRGKECLKKEIDEAQALDQLIEIIKADGKWIEPRS